jgi:type IV pilus assembly protein PilV
MRPHNAKTNSIVNSTKKLKQQGGFTLIEVLIALTIFAVGLLAIAAMQTSAIRMNSTAGHLTDLSTWGMDQLEQLMSLPYSDPWLDPAGNPPGGVDSAGNPHLVTTPDNRYQVQWTITDNYLTTNAKLIQLTVTGQGKRLQLTTIKAQSL